MQIAAVAPAIFVVTSILLPMPRPAGIAVRVEPDGSQTILPLLGCVSPGVCSPEFPLPDGRPLYVSFFGTGFGGGASPVVTCNSNGEPLDVTYAGPQATPGVDQINVRVPQSSRGLGTVVCAVVGVVTNPVWL